MKSALRRCLALVSFCLILPVQATPPRDTRPNVVILLADDLGYGDLGYHGASIKTPSIDRLAREGVRLDRFYACPACSPTRAGMLTGRWPIRYGLMRAVVAPWSRYGLSVDEDTLGDLLARAGYERRAVIGKWHLGHSARKYHPLNRGLTYFYGHYNGGIDYFTHRRENEIDWHRNWKPISEEGYSTDLIAREAVRFIRESPKDKPFFLYVPFNAPHVPWQAKQEDLARYPTLSGDRRTYAAMVDSMDQAIGRILLALDDRGISNNTFVLFFNDNGGVEGVADNSPLRGSKTTVYEGGIRVPAVARWPDGDLQGGRSVDQRMGYIDVYPTIKRIVGAKTPDKKPLDGRDMLDAMRGKSDSPDRDWYSFFVTTSSEHIAVSTDEWKLVVIGPGVLAEDSPRKLEVELFRIDKDPRERNDVADLFPDRVDELMTRVKRFRALMIDGAPDYNTGRSGFKAPKDWIIRD